MQSAWVLLRRKQILGSCGSFHSLLCFIWKLSEVNCLCHFFQDAFKRSLETSTYFHVWKFNFGKYRLPDTMHWGAFGEWQAASGVSTMLLCEEKMHFWKETTSTFQTWISHTELSASAVVVGNLLLFWGGLEPRNRPALLCHIFKARYASEAAKLNHSCVVALGQIQILIIIYVHYIPLISHIHINVYELHFLCISVTQWSRLASFIETSMCEFFKAEKQKKQTLKPHMAQKWFLITVTVTDHCWGMQKRKDESWGQNFQQLSKQPVDW